MKPQEINEIIWNHLKPQWALFNGRTYKIIRECIVDFAPGYELSHNQCRSIFVEKSLVEVY